MVTHTTSSSASWEMALSSAEVFACLTGSAVTTWVSTCCSEAVSEGGEVTLGVAAVDSSLFGPVSQCLRWYVWMSCGQIAL